MRTVEEVIKAIEDNGEEIRILRSKLNKAQQDKNNLTCEYWRILDNQKELPL